MENANSTIFNYDDDMLLAPSRALRPDNQVVSYFFIFLFFYFFFYFFGNLIPFYLIFRTRLNLIIKVQLKNFQSG